MRDNRQSAVRVALLVLAGIVVTLSSVNVRLWQAAEADDSLKPDLSLSAFMRKKLDASSLILEGLAVEDAELIGRGAKSLLQLSKVEKWQVLVDSEYRVYSIDFRSTVRKLEEAAEKGNFDNAALQWFDVTKSCIECHQHIRRERAKKK